MSAITPLLSYSFQRDKCLQNVFFYEGSGVVGTMNPKYPQIGCLNSNGVSSAGKISSFLPVSDLKTSLGTKDFAIEMWLRPKLNVTTSATILAIGKDSTTASDCKNNLAISQVRTASPTTIGFRVSGCNQAGVGTGNTLKSQAVTPTNYVDGPSLIHLSLNLRFSSMDGGVKIVVTQFFINGNATADGLNMFTVSQYGFDASTWNSLGKLILFPDNDISNPVQGRAGDVHSLAIFDQTVSESQVRSRYNQRLPNSLPVVIDSTIRIQENGEVGDHSTQPEFYLQPISTQEVSLVSLPVYDMENYAYGPPLLSARPKLLLSSLPANSHLYYPSGEEITQANMASSYITYDTTTLSYNVRLRPPLDRYSPSPMQPLFNFSYVAIDGVTGLQSAETAWVQVVVTHVNKPPTALPKASTFKHGGYTKLTIDGTDPDSVVTGAVITRMPTNGKLYSLPWRLPVNLTSNEHTLISGPPFDIEYQYTSGPRKVLGVDNIVGYDSFEFSTIDAEGRRSVPATYSLTLTSPVFATATVATTAAPKGVEDARAAIKLYGGDSSGQYFLNGRLVTLPVLGNLYYDPNTDIFTTPMQVGDAATWYIPVNNYTQGVNVYYQGPKDYFTSPTKTWNGTALNNPPDSFSFKMQAGTGPGSADSLPVTQYVHIKNVNDPSVITFRQSVVNTRELSVLSSDDVSEMHSTHTLYLDTPSSADFVHSNATATNSTAEDDHPIFTTSGAMPSSVILKGFAVVDPDLGVDPVHFVMTTTNGSTFRLNSDHLRAVDFNSEAYCRFGNVPWVCGGDGTTSQSSFVAAPSDAAKALNGMTFTFNGNLEDTLVVTMYDGVGGNCLSNEQLGTSTIYSGCYTSSVSIRMVGSSPSGTGGGGPGGSVSSALMARLMYVGIGLAVFFVLVAWRYFCIHRMRRNSSYEDDAETAEEKSTWTRCINLLCCYAPPTPRRKRKAASPGRTPKRAHKHRRCDSSSSDYSGSGSDSEDSGYGSTGEHRSDTGTEEEDYDVEAARTPQRAARQSQWSHSPSAAPTGSPPRTPKIYGGGTPKSASKTPDSNVRHESYANPCDRSKGETPTKTVVVYKDIILPNGKPRTEVTKVVIPMFEDEADYNAQQRGSSPTKKAKASSVKHRPFPDVSEEPSKSTASSPRKGDSSSKSASKAALGRPPSIATSPLRTTRLPGKRAPATPGSSNRHPEYASDHLHDHTDHTVSTMTCSVGGPSAHPSPFQQSPHAPPRPPPPPLRLQPTPERRAVASPASEASPVRTHNTASPSQSSSRTRKAERYGDETDYNHTGALAQTMRTPERVSPQKCRPSGSKHGADVSSGHHTERTSSPSKRSKTRESTEHSSVVSGNTGVMTASSDWTIHTHRSGRIFYHNELTGKSTWKKPIE